MMVISRLVRQSADGIRSSDDDSDDEDETAALMAELAKIKQERAEEKARLVSLDLSHPLFLIIPPLPTDL